MNECTEVANDVQQTCPGNLSPSKDLLSTIFPLLSCDDLMQYSKQTYSFCMNTLLKKKTSEKKCHCMFIMRV